jgi:5-formyltetrahydrofolate cyclo-ligase
MYAGTMIDERPLHSQVRDYIRDIVLAAPLGQRTMIPTEPEIAETMRVSRGTVRKAVDAIVGEGLLTREQGRGTFVEPGAQVRRHVASRLAVVAKPDSRFDDDFESFIPDFEGSDKCADTVAGLEAYQRAETVFIARDNNLQPLRERALNDGKRVIVPSHALRTGLRVLDRVPKSLRRFASMLDGVDEFATPVAIEDVGSFGPVSLAATGAVAVTRDGLMLGARHDYFRIEVAILAATHALAPDAITVGVVHDCQVIDLEAVARDEGSSLLDLVVTPTKTYTSQASASRRPHGKEDLNRDLLNTIKVSAGADGHSSEWVDRLLLHG